MGKIEFNKTFWTAAFSSLGGTSCSLAPPGLGWLCAFDFTGGKSSKSGVSLPADVCVWCCLSQTPQLSGLNSPTRVCLTSFKAASPPLSPSMSKRKQLGCKFRPCGRPTAPLHLSLRPTCSVKAWHHHRFFALSGAPLMMSKPMPACKKNKKTRPDQIRMAFCAGFAFLQRLPCRSFVSVSALVCFLLSTAVSGRCGAFTGVLPPCCCCCRPCCCSWRGYVTRSITAKQPESQQRDGWRWGG